MGDRRAPNVLVVMSDEQSWDTLGANGNDAAVTPVLDELCAEATVYDGCYTPYPLCCPSRASLWTGRMPRHHGVLGNWRAIRPQFARAGLARWFGDGGYHSIYCGKWHVPGTTPAAMGWADVSAIPAVLDGRDRGRYIESYRAAATGAGYALAPDSIENLTVSDVGSPTPYGTAEIDLDHYLETWQTGQFLSALERRPRDRPWLAVCSYNAPHFPMVVPAPYDRLIDRDRVRLPPSWATGPGTTPREVRESHFATEFADLDEPGWVEMIAHYWGMCSLVDAQLGRVREYLRDEREWDRTIVVFVSDHGDLMGAHRLMEKGHLLHYEEDLRVPLIIRDPGGAPARVRGLVSLCDLGVTLAELAGVPVDGPVDGRSFAATIGDSRAATPRDDVTAETMLFDGAEGGHGEGRWPEDWRFPRDALNLSVRTPQLRYVWRSHDVDELYDHDADPGEQRNLAADPAHAETCVRLRGRLADEVADELPAVAGHLRIGVALDARPVGDASPGSRRAEDRR